MFTIIIFLWLVVDHISNFENIREQSLANSMRSPFLLSILCGYENIFCDTTGVSCATEVDARHLCYQPCIKKYT